MARYTQDEKQAIFDTFIFDFEEDIRVDSAKALAKDLDVDFIPSYYTPDFLREHLAFVEAAQAQEG